MFKNSFNSRKVIAVKQMEIIEFSENPINYTSKSEYY